MLELSAILWSALGLTCVATLALLLYLDLRLYALKQCGALPASTPQLFGFAGGFAGVWQTVDLPLLHGPLGEDIVSLRIFRATRPRPALGPSNAER